MEVITDVKWIYPRGKPTEEKLRQMKEKERLRLEAIEISRLKKEQILLDKRLEIEERNVRQMMSKDRKIMLAEETKRRKKAEREARKHVSYPNLYDRLETTVYKLSTSYKGDRFFMFKHDALFHAVQELQDGNKVEITECQITPSKESSYEQVNIDIHDECPFCNNPDNTNRSETIEKYQKMLKNNDEIKENNKNLIKEYVEKLDAKTENILKEMEI
jgi:hypothetical protein